MDDTTRSIRIGPMDYQVSLVDDLHLHGQAVDGAIDHGKLTLTLDADACAPMALWQVMWHEIVHGILTQTKVRCNEQTVEIMANGICGVLRDRPEVGSVDGMRAWLLWGPVGTPSRQDAKGIVEEERL